MSIRMRCGKKKVHQPHWWKSAKLWCDGKKPTSSVQFAGDSDG